MAEREKVGDCFADFSAFRHVFRCDYCLDQFGASRSDAKFCSRKCLLKKHADENRDSYRKARNKYSLENRQKHLDSKRKYDRKYHALKSSCPIFRMKNSIRASVNQCLSRGGKFGLRTFDLLGYSAEDLMNHLERQFTSGMSWENYGEWRIDHIRPIASFSISGIGCDEFKMAWSLKNLRPLWAKDNMSKGAKCNGVDYRSRA